MTLNDLSSHYNEEESVPLTPLWAKGTLSSNEKLLEWFRSTWNELALVSEARIKTQWTNLSWYTGEYDALGNYGISGSDGRLREVPNQVLPFVINHISRITRTRVADLSPLKATFEVEARNNEERDRITARLLRPILEHIKRFNRAHMLFDKAELWNSIFGESFIMAEWNPRVGDKINADAREREGMVTLSVKEPWHVLPWPARQWEHVPCLLMVDEVLHVEEARKKYKNNKIEPDNTEEIYPFGDHTAERVRPEEVVIYRIIYKPDDYLPNGADIRLTKRLVLEKNVDAYPYSHEEFPLERHTDIDVPGRLFSMSFYQYLKPMQHTYNMLSGLIKKNFFLTNHPKWLVPRGSVDFKSLGNAATVVQYRQGEAPKLVNFPSISPDSFSFRGFLKQEMNEVGDTHTISMGQLPPNTRSGIMISRLEELERRGRAPLIDKRNDFMRRVLLKAAAVSYDYLPNTSEEHIERIVGPENIQDVKSMREVKISSGYDITIQNASGFSETLTGRIEELGLIKQQIGPILTPQQELDILSLRSPRKFYDIGTAAVKNAEAEIDAMNNGAEAPEPKSYQDQIVNWNVHITDMNTRGYQKLPQKIKNEREKYLLAREMLMEEAARKNPAFAERLMQLSGYPALFQPTPPPPLPPQSQVGPPLPPEQMGMEEDFLLPEEAGAPV